MITKDETTLEEIRAAAREGAREGAKKGSRHGRLTWGAGVLGSLAEKLILILILVAVLWYAGYKLNPITRLQAQIAELQEQLHRESAAREHDLVLDDHGFFGYTVADFAEPVLGNQSKLCKLEVLEQEVSDVTTLTEAGLGSLKIFSKNQLITYQGTALYTVDLSALRADDFALDEEKKEVTVYIPHAKLEPINIQSKDIEFGDVEKGLLAFGEITATPQDMSDIQTKAQEKMEQKIMESNLSDTADRFAKLLVWELFQPVINSVTKGYSLVVAFR